MAVIRAGLSHLRIHSAADIDIDVTNFDVHRDLAGGLVAVEQADCSVSVGELGDGGHVLNPAVREKDVCGGDQSRLPADHPSKGIDGHGGAVW